LLYMIIIGPNKNYTMFFFRNIPYVEENIVAPERLLVLAAASLVVSHAPFLSTTSQRINIRPWLGFRLTDYGAIISDVSLERMGYGVYLSPTCYTICTTE